jgi:ketosteroid isomerase-like protein
MSTATLKDNATSVAKLYEAFGSGDITYIVNQVADNCKWIGAGHGSLPQGGLYNGKDAANFFKKLLEAVEFTAFNPEAIHNINEREVVSFGNMTGNSRITGKTASSDWTMHFKFNDKGKLVYFQDFFDTAAAYLANQK